MFKVSIRILVLMALAVNKFYASKIYAPAIAQNAIYCIYRVIIEEAGIDSSS